MRLEKVESGHRLQQKLFLLLVQLISFRKPFDVVKLFMYRPEYFGKNFCSLGNDVLRGPPIGTWVSGSCLAPSLRN